MRLPVHWELTDSRERDTEKARRGGHNNQTEQKEAQAHPAAAHVPTTQSKFSFYFENHLSTKNVHWSMINRSRFLHFFLLNN